MTSCVPDSLYIFLVHLYIARVSITRAISFHIAVTDGLVSEHLVCCDTTCSHELTHKPVACAVKPLSSYSPWLSWFQVGSACPADGVVAVLESKPVPECKE